MVNIKSFVPNGYYHDVWCGMGYQRKCRLMKTLSFIVASGDLDLSIYYFCYFFIGPSSTLVT